MHVIKVSPSSNKEQYHVITDTIKKAPSGSIIEIMPNVYYETLFINKAITLRGLEDDNGNKVRIFPKETAAVVLSSHDIHIENILFNGVKEIDYPLIDIFSGHVVIRNCAIEGMGWSALMSRGTSSAVLHNVLFNNKKGSAIYAMEASSLDINNSMISNISISGIIITQKSSVTITNTNINNINGHCAYIKNNGEFSINNSILDSVNNHMVAVTDNGVLHIKSLKASNAKKNVLYLNSSNNINIDTLSIDHCESNAIEIINSSKVAIKNIVMNDIFGMAFLVSNKSYLLITDTVITNVKDSGIYIKENASVICKNIKFDDILEYAIVGIVNVRLQLNNISIINSGNGFLVNNSILKCEKLFISHVTNGFVVESKSDLLIKNSELNNNILCISSVNDSNFEIHGVSITNSKNAILIDGSKCNILESDIYNLEKDAITAKGNAVLQINKSRIRQCSENGIVLNDKSILDISNSELEYINNYAIYNNTHIDITHNNVVFSNNQKGNILNSTIDSGKKNLIVDGKEDENKQLTLLMDKLNGLIGLHSVKLEVAMMTNLLKLGKMRSKIGLPSPPMNRHLVFTGNPGTGKTTIARLYASILFALSVLDKGQFIEVSRLDLVANIVGGTAIKTDKEFKRALGGVFFIDEAYALSSASGISNDFGKEAIDTLVKLMEDYRNEVVVIVAGYSTEMRQFLNSNPGLSSRFNKVIHFDDYSNEEMVTIVESMCKEHQYELHENARTSLIAYFDQYHRDKNFGNARLARKVFETMISNHAYRVGVLNNPTLHELTNILPDDIPSTILDI